MLNTLGGNTDAIIKYCVPRITQAETREKALINEAILMAGERRKGREEQKREIAMKMFAEGMSSNVIAKLTGLDIGEVEKLKSTS